MKIPPPNTRIRSTKTYVHAVGLSCCFRQHKAESHCKFLHGYALQVRLEFEAEEVDQRNFVVDFGSLKSLKGWLEDTLDHKTLVAEDDPVLNSSLASGMRLWQFLRDIGVIDPVMVPATGCEAIASMIYETTEVWLKDNGYHPRVKLAKVEVSEHGANSAIVERTT